MLSDIVLCIFVFIRFGNTVFCTSALHSSSGRKEKKEDELKGNSPTVPTVETTAIDGFHDCGSTVQYRGRGT